MRLIYFVNQWISCIEYSIVMKVLPLDNGPNGSAIAWYHIGIPVIIAFRATLHQEKNIRIL